MKLEDIPWDDEATFRLLAAGETEGVFQLESAGMKRMLKKLKPTSLDDIAAALALYRPGAMAHIDEYVRRKNEGQLENTS